MLSNLLKLNEACMDTHCCPLTSQRCIEASLNGVQVVGFLMHEIECILHEYLSFNWDRVDDIYDANAMYLSADGLKCLWSSHSNLQVRNDFLTCPSASELLFMGAATDSEAQRCKAAANS